MTSSGSAIVSSDSQRERSDRAANGLRLAADATRALAGLAGESSDSALLVAVGQAIVPTLGELCALVARDEAGEIQLAAMFPSESALAQQLRHQLAAAPGALTDHLDGFQERTVLLDALGVSAELAVAVDGAPADEDGVLVIWTTDEAHQYDEHDRELGEVLAALLGGRRLARGLDTRVETLRRQLGDAAQAGRELAHLLNNDLTMPVGVVELLLDRGPVSPELHEMLQAAAKDLAALEQHVRMFHDQMRSQSGDNGSV